LVNEGREIVVANGVILAQTRASLSDVSQAKHLRLRKWNHVRMHVKSDNVGR